jgi:hypothetical protein
MNSLDPENSILLLVDEETECCDFNPQKQK